MKRSWVVTMVLLLTAVPVAITSPALAAPGDLDTTFSDDGHLATDFTSGEDTGYGVAVQADGKIVVVGSAGGEGGRFALARYNPDGTLDIAFGGSGQVTTNFTRWDDGAYGVAIQADGKIVAAGWAGFGSGRSGFALARYNPDGVLDTTFNGGGKVTTRFKVRYGRRAVSYGAWASGVAIQADGKIVASGIAGPFAGDRFALARYHPSGALDTTFSRDGKVTTKFTSCGGQCEVAWDVDIQADGKIVAAGEVRSRFALARYTSNGRLDKTFSGDGKIRTTFTSDGDAAYGIDIQADGKIVAVGHAHFDSYPEFALARYNTDGTLDATFGGSGKVTNDFGCGCVGAYAVAIQADGKIVAVGWQGFALAVARFNTDGSPDTAFGTDGLAWTDSGEAAEGVAIQADGKIVAAGYVGESGGMFVVARFLAA